MTPPPSLTLHWSNLATIELEQIRNFSRQHWGAAVARTYLANLRDTARKAAADPTRLRPLRPPFHILRARSHYLIVHLDPEARTLTIAHILHTAMDIERHLPAKY